MLILINIFGYWGVIPGVSVPMAVESGKVPLSLIKEIQHGKVSDMICKASISSRYTNIPHFKQHC